jgi:hypothetical protein
MVVWGGFDGEGWLDTGGQYSFDAAPPTGLSAPILEDPVVCSTGVAVHWDADPTRWNDSGDTASRNYRVFRNGVALASGGCSGPLAYGTTSCLDDSTTPMQAYTYTVAYNNACGFSAQTPAAGITDIGFVTPVISGPNPACLPGTLTTGAYPSYQWKLDGMPISGANGSSLFATLEGTYTVEVTDGNGCSGNSAPYQFYDPPVPTVEGLSTSCTSVSLSTQPFAHYQWRRNSSDITGANAQSYSAFASGSYAVRVTDLNGCEGTSVAKAVTIHPDPEPSISPATQTICQTLTASFSVTHNGTGAIYTWRKDGIDLVDGPHHSGTATATLTILDATAAESGSYTCFVDLGSCAQESPAGTLVVKPCSSPTLTAEPAFTQDTSNALSWGAISEAMGYEVQASTDSFATTSQTSGTIPGLAHTFTGLVTDITYQYRVKAIFTYGESLWSALQVSTQDALPPASAISTPLAGAILYGPLADLSGTASDATSGVASVAVSWDGGTNWYPATGTTAWAFTWTLPLDGPYTLLSRATDGVDNVEAPTGVAVTVRNRPLAATGVTVTDVPYDGGGVLDITWTLSADDGAGLNYVAGYSVWRASAALGPFTQIGSVPAGQTFYEDGSAGTGANRYYKVRAYTGYDVLYNWTDSAVVGPTMATNEPPLPVNNLQADLTSGCNVRLTWVESPSPDILLYNIYYDAGTGTVNFTTPFATVMAPAATWVSSGLALDTRYIFSVRAKDLAGQEDGLTANRVSIVTHCDLNIVRAEIKHPQAGRTLQGNQITVNADLIQGTRAEVSSVRLQYRTSGSGPWTDIVGFPGEPNPVTTWPYLIHWDVTALADGDYDLRAVASDLTPAPDPYPPFVTVTVLTGNGSRSSSSTTAKIIEQSVGSDHQASVESYRGSGNLNATAFIQDQNLMQVSIPKGNLPQTIDRIILQDLSPSNFAKAKPHGVVRSPKGVLDLGSSLVAANIYRSVILQGGKTSFGGGGADLVFFVKDENNDHIVDGTTIPLNDLDVFLDEGSGSWSLQRTNRTVDLVNKFIRVTVAQVGTYGLFSYPKPATVQGLILERSGDDVVLTWQPVSMDEKGTPITIDHYNVYYGSTPNFIADIVNWTNVLPEANKGDTTITDVNPPSPRYYLVTAIDTTGKESYPSEHIGP